MTTNPIPGVPATFLGMYLAAQHSWFEEGQKGLKINIFFFFVCEAVVSLFFGLFDMCGNK